MMKKSLIGDPSLDQLDERESTFDENLAEQIDAKELNAVANLI